jgi:hypothetical protein
MRAFPQSADAKGGIQHMLHPKTEAVHDKLDVDDPWEQNRKTRHFADDAGREFADWRGRSDGVDGDDLAGVISYVSDGLVPVNRCKVFLRLASHDV